MDIARADIVQSTAGRDQGGYFFVLDTEGDFLLLADGKTRRAERPKRKKRRHVQLFSRVANPVGEKIRNNQTITNNELRKTLAATRKEGNENQEG